MSGRVILYSARDVETWPAERRRSHSEGRNTLDEAEEWISGTLKAAEAGWRRRVVPALGHFPVR
ncbi:hypothetical protein [Streptomyces sp. CAU 1734]|uniref:hypothetical protein n=1 Tax=Streptomyces sp. CAU 1734 TaxID=3140360 RepID=UPI003261A214